MIIDTEELESVRRLLHLDVKTRHLRGEISAEMTSTEHVSVERLIDREVKRQYRTHIPDDRANH